jgi:hypothetical protein
MLKSRNYVSFTATVMPILHTHDYIYRNSTPNTVTFLESNGLKDKKSYGNNVVL